jgi:hypothetical protein
MDNETNVTQATTTVAPVTNYSFIYEKIEWVKHYISVVEAKTAEDFVKAVDDAKALWNKIIND